MYYIGIDGGGTGTRGLLSNSEGRILADRETGPSNPTDITTALAADTIADLIRDLVDDAQADDAPLAIFAGVAGALSLRDELLAALDERLSDLTVSAMAVDSDIRILLSAEIPTGDGAAVISGTGSACFVRRGEELIRIGGWGYLLDSAGNGYSIGRDAIEAALRARDGRGEATSLSRRLFYHYGAPVEDLIPTIYREGKPYIASCTPCVFDAAENGDPVALAILDRNAAALAELCETAYHTVYPTDPPTVPMPIALGGGLFQHRPEWLRRVSAGLTPDLPVRLSVVSNPPVMGALSLARRLL